MGTLLVIQDSHLRPDLFLWNGAIAAAELRSWLTEHGLGACPGDLVHFWEETGGGEIFETETILGPFGDPTMDDALVPTNDALRLRGLPDNLVVFHIGLGTSAVDTTAGDYVDLDPHDFHELRRFQSLDAWYVAIVRDEYAGRYGLPSRIDGPRLGR
jgi:hypothetical protein